MFEAEKIDGEAFIVKRNHHIHQKWDDFRRIRNKWIYLYGYNHNIAWTHNGVPFWNYPPRVGYFSKEIVFDDNKLITCQLNNPRWAKWYRSRNGKTEWGYVQDAWAKPYVQGKSSRHMMRQKQTWWEQVDEYYEALHNIE